MDKPHRGHGKGSTPAPRHCAGPAAWGTAHPTCAGQVKGHMVYAVPGLTDKQRQRLFEDFGVGKTVIGCSKERVKRELKGMRGW